MFDAFQWQATNLDLTFYKKYCPGKIFLILFHVSLFDDVLLNKTSGSLFYEIQCFNVKQRIAIWCHSYSMDFGRKFDPNLRSSLRLLVGNILGTKFYFF